jgi:hypothetical protein
MASAWLDHVKKTMGGMKGKPFKEVLKAAAKSYKKTSAPAKKSAKVRSLESLENIKSILLYNTQINPII